MVMIFSYWFHISGLQASDSTSSVSISRRPGYNFELMEFIEKFTSTFYPESNCDVRKSFYPNRIESKDNTRVPNHID